MGFGAEDEVKLSPFEDDKPKDAENTDFEADSNNTPMATQKHLYMSNHIQVFFVILIIIS